LALGIESNNKNPNCIIYDLQTQKFRNELNFKSSTKSTYYKAINFAKTNEKMLVTITGQPDNNLTVWSFEKKEVSQVVSKNLETMNEVRDVSFNPMDHNNLIVIGDQIFKN